MLIKPALVRMRYHARVHQRRRGIAIFLAEIGADQLLPLSPMPAIGRPTSLRNLEIAAGTPFGLPVPGLRNSA